MTDATPPSPTSPVDPGAGPGLRRATTPSPIGTLHVVVSAIGVRAIRWDGDDEVLAPFDAEPVEPGEDPLVDAAVAQLDEYFAGRRTTFDLPLDLVGTEFQVAAWRALTEIPYGQTRSYGEQAARIGRPTAVRAVGAANGRNPVGIVVPCHRVVGADGSLTGFAGGLDAKRFLLTHERSVTGGAPDTLFG